jgi:hypothetical protein
MLPLWQQRYPTTRTQNNQNRGYNTHGILVPIGKFKKVAKSIYTVPFVPVVDVDTK